MAITKQSLVDWHRSKAKYFQGMAQMHHDFAATENAVRHNLAKEYKHRAKDYDKEHEFHTAAADFLENENVGNN